MKKSHFDLSLQQISKIDDLLIYYNIEQAIDYYLEVLITMRTNYYEIDHYNYIINSLKYISTKL